MDIIFLKNQPGRIFLGNKRCPGKTRHLVTLSKDIRVFDDGGGKGGYDNTISLIVKLIVDLKVSVF